MRSLHGPPTIRLVEQADAEAMAGGPSIMEELRRFWSLQAAHCAKGFHFFDVAAIKAALARKEQSLARC